MTTPSVLCPVDFSGSSRGALRYAASIAGHFGAGLTLLAVNDPLFKEADEYAGNSQLEEETRRELDRFFSETFPEQVPGVSDVRREVTIGKPPQEILRVAREQQCNVIVMSSHGVTGFRKLFFGSTTERVLREAMVPVLVTPESDRGPQRFDDLRRLVRRVLVPVDLTPATSQPVHAARRVAETLAVPLVLLHVVEPARPLAISPLRASKIDAERRYRAERELEAAADAMPENIKAEALIAYGEAAEEIAKVASDRDAGLIVMGLHSSPLLGPRMGSVTYRVLCLAHRLVLAVPPPPDGRT